MVRLQVTDASVVDDDGVRTLAFRIEGDPPIVLEIQRADEDDPAYPDLAGTCLVVDAGVVIDRPFDDARLRADDDVLSFLLSEAAAAELGESDRRVDLDLAPLDAGRRRAIDDALPVVLPERFGPSGTRP